MTLVWPNTWQEQNSEYATLLSRLESVDRQISPATYINSAEPANEAALDTAWAFKKGGSTQVPQNSKTQWYNPNTNQVENVFVKLADISPFAVPLTGRQASTPQIELISSTVVTVELGAQASVVITPPKAYDQIRVIGQIRSSNATASTTLAVRINNSGAAIYNTLIHRVTTATTFDRITLVNQTTMFGTNYLVPAAAGNTPKNVFSSFTMDFYFPSRKSQYFGMWSSYVDDGGVAEQQLCTFAGSVTSLAITTLTYILAAGSLDIGTWITAYGINSV